MANKKTADNATYGEPSPNDGPNEDGAPHSEVDKAKQRAKLLTELVAERKKVDVATRDLMKKIKDNETNVTKYQSTITARDKTIADREVQLAQQKAVVETLKVRLTTKEQFHKTKRHEWQVEHDAAVAVLNGQLVVKKSTSLAERSRSLQATRDLAATAKSLRCFEDDIRRKSRSSRKS
jgi:hypothetical protein